MDKDLLHMVLEYVEGLDKAILGHDEECVPAKTRARELLLTSPPPSIAAPLRSPNPVQDAYMLLGGVECRVLSLLGCLPWSGVSLPPPPLPHCSASHPRKVRHALG